MHNGKVTSDQKRAACLCYERPRPVNADLPYFSLVVGALPQKTRLQDETPANFKNPSVQLLSCVFQLKSSYVAGTTDGFQDPGLSTVTYKVLW